MADLSCFATKAKSEEGVIVPIKIKGTKLPLAIQIFGSDCDLVKEFERNRIRKIGIGKNGKTDIDEETIDELLETQDETIVIRMGDVFSYDWKKKEVTDEPVILNGVTIGNDKKSKAYLIDQIPDLKSIITDFSNERSNFLA